MNYFRKVLAIGAHPDDVEFSCYGYLSKLKDNGADISVYIASNGCVGDPTSGSHRLKESEHALHRLTNTIYSRNVSGIEAQHYESISQEIREIVLNFQPDLVLVHSQHDTHQEHILLREIVITALRRISTSLISYKSVSVTADYRENIFIDVSKFIEEKIMALESHKTQSNHLYMQPDHIKSFHINWFALMRDIQFAESFYLEQMVD